MTQGMEIVNALRVLAVFASLLYCGSSWACGSLPAAEQAKRNAVALEKQRELVRGLVRAADTIVVGTVIALTRVPIRSVEAARVAIAVNETLKGPHQEVLELRWKDAGVISCDPAISYSSVGFREGGRFIVYARDGVVLRSGGLYETLGGRLGSDEERRLVKAFDDR